MITMLECLRLLAKNGFAPGAVLDVGAGCGDWLNKAVQCWPRAKYWCVEPLEERHPALRKFQADYSVVIAPLGLGASPGTLPMTVTADLDSSSFLFTGACMRSIPIETIDRLLALHSWPTPDLLKLDVQGFELEILNGYQPLESASVVILETSFIRFAKRQPVFAETVAYMDRRGFQAYQIMDFLSRPLDGALGQCDLCFVRKDHPLVRDLRWRPDQ